LSIKSCWNESIFQNVVSQLCSRGFARRKYNHRNGQRAANCQHTGCRSDGFFFVFWRVFLKKKTGIVLELSPSQSSNFWALFRALISRNSETAASLILDRGGRVPGRTNEPQFRIDLHKAFANLPGATAPLETESKSLAAALMEVLSSARRCGVMLDTTFVSLIVSCIVLEGTGMRLDPTMSLFHLAKQMVKSQFT
jgi:hypothetical protein